MLQLAALLRLTLSLISKLNNLSRCGGGHTSAFSELRSYPRRIAQAFLLCLSFEARLLWVRKTSAAKRMKRV